METTLIIIIFLLVAWIAINNWINFMIICKNQSFILEKLKKTKEDIKDYLEETESD